MNKELELKGASLVSATFLKEEDEMKKTPTLLMKELKFLQSEAERLHLEDTERRDRKSVV